MIQNEIGVFLGCTGFQEPEKALSAAKELDLRIVQAQSLQLSEDYFSREGAHRFARLLEDYGIEACSVCIVHEGERYDDWATVGRTVGYLPLGTLSERLKYSMACVDFAANIDAPIVTTHMGILPKDYSQKSYQRLLEAVRKVARYCQKKGVTLALETGQETGTELLEFIERTAEEVKVNFDGANLILYGLDDPLRTLELLKELVVQVHVKDGLPPSGPGLLGEEVRLGEGRAEVRKTVCNLVNSRYTGPFIMEIYTGRKQKTCPLSELRKGKAFLERCLGKYPRNA